MTTSIPNVAPFPSAVDLVALLQRIGVLEEDVAQLKNSANDKSNWIDKIDGSFKDDPGYDEVIELGRQIRKSDFS